MSPRQQVDQAAERAAHHRCYSAALASWLTDGDHRATRQEARAAFRAWAALLLGAHHVPEWDSASALHAAYDRRRRARRRRRRR